MQNTRFRLSTFFVMAIVCIAQGCTSNNTVNRAEAEAFLRSYTSAVASGDSAYVCDFWSPRSRDREGFWTMHYSIGSLMPFVRLSEAMRQTTFEIRDIASHIGYTVVLLDWIHGEEGVDARRHPMRFYFVREHGRHVLINPIDLLTADWELHETEFFRFHVPPGVRTMDHIYKMDLLTREVGTIAERLEIDPPTRMDYYCARTQNECGELMLQRPSNGYASLARGLIVSLTFDNTHEAVHLLCHRAGIGPGNDILSEDLAVAFGGNTRTTADDAPLQVSRLLDGGRYLPLHGVFADRDAFFRRNYITYFEVGAFVRFLFEAFGVEKLKTLIRGAEATSDIEGLLRSTYDRPLPELERAFITWLQARGGADIGTTIPDGTKRLFYASDPSGDDSGDGDYRYPNDRFEAGVFDLTAFEVFADDTQVYFRLTFAALGQPVSYRPGGERFVPGAVIAINRRRGGHLGSLCHGVTFGEGNGFDLGINIGLHVSLVNANGKVFWSSRNDIPRKPGAGGTIAFSMPISLIGRPETEWQYFVGIGLVSDRTMDFLYAGPMPVVKEEPRVLIRGGNREHGNPAFIDVLLPPGLDQARILSDYDPALTKCPVVPMVPAQGR